MLFLLALMLACGPTYNDVQITDTVEAYDKWIADHPGDMNNSLAEKRIEELLFKAAQEAGTVEAYDAYLSRYKDKPGAKLMKKVMEAREPVLFSWAEQQNTADAWKTYLADYEKTGARKRISDARRRIVTAEYMANLEIAPLEVEPANLAENPDGPLDGWAWRSSVTNKGDRTIQYFGMRIDHLDAEGKVVGHTDWPLVASRAPGNLPIEEEWKQPIKPGETRQYYYLDTAPESPNWAKRSKLVPLGIVFLGEGANAGEE